MSAFNSSRFFSTELTDMSNVIKDTCTHFTTQGYEVKSESSSSEGFISLSKGGIFKSVLGMKTSLNVELDFTDGGISVNAKVGIFGKQLIPSLITLFVAWPVMIAQISGLIKQAKLDDEVMDVIGRSIDRYESKAQTSDSTEYCVACGVKQ